MTLTIARLFPVKQRNLLLIYKKYAINNPYIKDSLSINAVTPDTNIFIVLMYNLKKHLERLMVLFTEERAVCGT